MAEYVDKAVVVDMLRTKAELGRASGYGTCYDNAAKMVKLLPAADVAPVVRCKDCTYWTKIKDSAQGRCALFCHYPTGSWYCANGERKEDE